MAFLRKTSSRSLDAAEETSPLAEEFDQLWSPAQATRPTRRVFALTEAGQQALADWVQSPVARGREVRLDFLAKLYCARAFGPEVVAQLIARQRAALEGWLAGVRREAVADPDQFAALVDDFRAGQIEAMLAWLEKAEHTLPTG